MQLLDLLNQTDGARVVNVSSSAHRFGNLDFADLNWEKRKYKQWNAYGDSKIANLYFTSELDRQLKAAGSKVVATSAHPGYTATELQRTMPLSGLANRIFAQDISMGALPTLRAAFDRTAKGGEFYGPGGFLGMRGYPVVEQPRELAMNTAIAERLWNVSTEMTRTQFVLGVER